MSGPPHRATVRTAHLRKAPQFQAVRKQGRWWSHRLLAMGVLANGQASSRCGFSVGRRLGTAVTRNRARRRLREAVRLQWALVAPGWDIVFAARDAIREAPFSEIQSAVATLLQRAHLVQEGLREAAPPGGM